MPHKDPEARREWSRKHYAEDSSVRARHKEAQHKWEAEHKDERNDYQAKWAKDHRFKNYVDARAYEFAREMKKYTVTTQWYTERLIEQNGLCAICGHLSHYQGKIQRLQVDHDHSCCDIKAKSCGKCNRGLLCADCNMNLSYLEKTMAEATVMPTEGTWTDRAMDYLYSYRKPDLYLDLSGEVTEPRTDLLPYGALPDIKGDYMGITRTYPGRLSTPTITNRQLTRKDCERVIKGLSEECYV